MKYIAKVEDKSFEVVITETDNKLIVKLDGQPVTVDFVQVKAPAFFSFLMDNKSFDVEIIKNSESYWVNMNGRKYECVLEDEKIQKIKDIVRLKKEILHDRELKSPMPGLVVAIVKSIRVKPGQAVEKDEVLVVFE
jgi:acetyl/propionyl-CoA carboxylase alpha subunit